MVRDATYEIESLTKFESLDVTGVSPSRRPSFETSLGLLLGERTEQMEVVEAKPTILNLDMQRVTKKKMARRSV